MPPADPDARSDSAPPHRVLIVDDNAAVTKALGMLVRNAGFDAIPCHSGNDALSYCDGGGKPPDAAVIDIHLPDINGLVLARTLRDRFGPTTPIIVVSGDTSMETIKSLSHVGATYFFSKPLNSAALVKQLKELVGGNGNGNGKAKT